MSYTDSLHFFSYSDPDTIDGEKPLCGEAIAWRHPQFGNYSDGELALSFVSAHTHYYSRTVFDGFTCLVWLLTNAADWLPEAHRSRLTNGMRTHTYCWASSSHIVSSENTLREALSRRTKSTFRFSREVRSGLEELVEEALKELGISESVAAISRRFMEGGFVEGYFAQQNRIREMRSGSEKRSRRNSTR